MIGLNTHTVPATGWKGLVQNWRADLLAAISVSLVAMPLGLGVAVASGAEPVSGLISAIIGGIVVTLFRASHLAINGPAAGLIAVILSGLVSLKDGSGQTFNYMLAAISIAGGLQVLLGVFKLGKIAEILPSSVIQGVMVAIGIIIFSSQMHVAFGTSSDAENTVGVFWDVFVKMKDLNPFIFIIAALGIAILVIVPRIKLRLFEFFPASLWVLVFSIPFVYLFNFFEAHEIALGGKMYHVGPEYLINIPTDLTNIFMFPNYSKIGTLPFWLVVISLTLIASIQTLAMTKAVDKLDPYKRKSNLNKDLIGVGIGTMVSGMLGGLPIITVIVRSTVNIHNSAKTKWSNFYHGLLLIVFLILLAPLIQQIPLAALAAILVFIGFKLASPNVFKQIYEMGIEQLLFLIVTLVITLYTDLLVGILCGTIFTLLVQILLARLPIGVFFHLIFKSKTNIHTKEDGSYELNIQGVANFLSLLSLNKLLDEIPAGSKVKINFAHTRLVDMTYMERVIDFLKEQENNGGEVQITGLDQHVSSSTHNRALKIFLRPMRPKLSPRQVRLRNIAKENNYVYQSQVNWNTSYLRHFHFFEIRPIERKDNCVNGQYAKSGIKWELADVTFNEGVAEASEIHHSTVQVVYLPVEIPRFILEEEGIFDKLFDRIMAFSGYKDIDFELYTDFSKKFLLMGESQKEIRAFFTPEVIEFLEAANVYHIESNGEALLIFKRLRLAKTNETLGILNFSEQLTEKILA